MTAPYVDIVVGVERAVSACDETTSDEAGVRATIDLQVRSGDELRVFAAKECDDMPEVRGITECTCGDAERRRLCVCSVQLQDAIGGMDTWLHCVHSDAMLRDFASNSLQETGDTRTCCIRQNQIRYRLTNCTRCDRDDSSPLAFLHARKRRIAHADDRQQVLLERFCILRWCRRRECACRWSSAICDQDVDMSEPIDGLFHEHATTGLCVDVAHQCDCTLTEGACSRRDALFISTAYGDCHASLDQRSCRCQAKAR